jgi:MFS family permease
MSMKRILPASSSAFRHRPFRVYWNAQLISMMGTFMQQVALGYLVYNLTGSKWLLGLIAAIQMGPSLVLSLPAGVLADRVQRRWLIAGTQSTALVLAFALATLTATNQLQVWEILVISAISGIAIAVESPARQAFVSDLVGRQDLANAIAWNSLVLNGARVIGPAIGGVAIRFVGVVPIFYFNSFSFLAMIAVLSMMSLHSRPLSEQRHPVTALIEGLNYVRNTSSIVLILALTAVVAILIMNFSVLMPILARDLVHTNAEGLGWMWASLGLGAVAGSMTVVSWSGAAVRGPLLLLSAVLSGLVMMVMALATSLGSMLALLAVTGWSTGAFFASANSAIQHRVDDHMRGRVLSLYAMIFAGSTPVGSLIIAGIASAAGTPVALVTAGGLCLVASLAMSPLFLARLRGPIDTRVPPPLAEQAS